MPLDPPRLGHLLFYKFSPYVHIRYHTIGAFSPRFTPPPFFLVYNLTRSLSSNCHALRSEHLGQATQRSKE